MKNKDIKKYALRIVELEKAAQKGKDVSLDMMLLVEDLNLEDLVKIDDYIISKNLLKNVDKTKNF